MADFEGCCRKGGETWWGADYALKPQGPSSDFDRAPVPPKGKDERAASDRLGDIFKDDDVHQNDAMETNNPLETAVAFK